jgi:hypothetical protein
MAEQNTVDLLSNVAVTGAYFRIGLGGVYTLCAEGTFGGATVGMQLKGPNGGAITGPAETQFTAPGICTLDIGAGQEVRMAVTGGAPSGLYVKLRLVYR